MFRYVNIDILIDQYTLVLNVHSKIKSQADTPIRRDRACLPRQHPGRDIFAGSSRCFPGILQTAQNDFHLYNFVD